MRQGVVASHPLIDEVLDAFRPAIAGDLPGYRGHVYRVFNFSRALVRDDGNPDDRLALAAVFHDLGIWSDGTVDYLGPSAERVRAHLAGTPRAGWSDELGRMVEMHHKLTPYRGEHARLVEAFRRADLVDLSLGLVRFGLPGALLRDIRAAFPYADFHRRVVTLVGSWALGHPLRPLPMLRW